MSNNASGCDIVLELCALDNSKHPPAQITERPVWESVGTALEGAFKNGGFVYLKVLGPSQSFINELCMKSLPGQYRLVVLTKSPDPKAELQEWWEQGILHSEVLSDLVMTIGMRERYALIFLLHRLFLENSSTVVIYQQDYCKCVLSGIRNHSLCPPKLTANFPQHRPSADVVLLEKGTPISRPEKKGTDLFSGPVE